jgi:hypothetical protein
MLINKRKILMATFMLFAISASFASDVSQQLQQQYMQKGATTFSTNRGQQLWESDNNSRSCTTCHTRSVKNLGKHQKTGKVIQPMAPSINPKRLTDKRKVKKWLLRNCKWTLKRECTAQEKGDILMWLSQQ